MKHIFLRIAAEHLQARLCLLLVLAANGVAVGDESSPTSPDGGVVGKAAVRPAHIDDAKKERVVTAAVFLLVLVVIVGVALLLAVVLWGRSVRRIARKPTAHISPGDELWYLKPDKTEPANQPVTGIEQSEPPDSKTDVE